MSQFQNNKWDWETYSVRYILYNYMILLIHSKYIARVCVCVLLRGTSTVWSSFYPDPSLWLLNGHVWAGVHPGKGQESRNRKRSPQKTEWETVEQRGKEEHRPKCIVWKGK